MAFFFLFLWSLTWGLLAQTEEVEEEIRGEISTTEDCGRVNMAERREGKESYYATTEDRGQGSGAGESGQSR